MTTVTAEEAIERVRAIAFEIVDPGTPEHGRQIVHTIAAGGFGADWDLATAEFELREATEIREVDAADGRHRLYVSCRDGMRVRMEAAAPAEVPDLLDSLRASLLRAGLDTGRSRG